MGLLLPLRLSFFVNDNGHALFSSYCSDFHSRPPYGDPQRVPLIRETPMFDSHASDRSHNKCLKSYGSSLIKNPFTDSWCKRVLSYKGLGRGNDYSPLLVTLVSKAKT